MAKTQALKLYIVVSLVHLLALCGYSNQLPFSQYQSLMNIVNMFNDSQIVRSYGSPLDFCNMEPTAYLTLVCYDGNLTQLQISGRQNERSLSQGFSTEDLFANIASLSSLKVLSLVSLALTGAMPATIGSLKSLEILNVSSNYFTGEVPKQLSGLKGLQSLVLDRNNFSGEVPSWLSTLPNLSLLSLESNLLNGTLPDSLASMQNLRILSLSSNKLSGNVPELEGLTDLQVLQLGDNNFGPQFPELSNSLVNLVLKGNSFKFGLPSDFGSYYQLQMLDISSNSFEGPFSPALFSLTSLNHLDISHNKFTGMLSENMPCSQQLSYVDLSFNLISGDLPTCLSVTSQEIVVQYANNCLSNQQQLQHPLSFCQNEALAVTIGSRKEKHGGSSSGAVLVSSTMGGSILAFAMVGLAFIVVRNGMHKNLRKKQGARIIEEKVSSVDTVKLLSDAGYISQVIKLGATIPAYRPYFLEELQEATRDFDSLNFLGELPNGLIHKGELADGSLVAVRSLTLSKKYNNHTSTQLVELISKLRHRHLLSALGHCFDSRHPDDTSISKIFLVFEFVPNGTLRDWISGKHGRNLTWMQRIAAAVGIARGLQFLHTGIVPGIFSNTLKITDILVDNNFHVKIISYNLPILSETRTMACGASFSFDGTRKESEGKQDIYDFGVILLEILVGRHIISEEDVTVSKDILVASLADDSSGRRNAVDPSIRHECSECSLTTMMEICTRCLEEQPDDRPSIDDVLWNLLFATQVQEPPKGDSNNYTVPTIPSPSK